jgi:hypothetical protein
MAEDQESTKNQNESGSQLSKPCSIHPNELSKYDDRPGFNYWARCPVCVAEWETIAKFKRLGIPQRVFQVDKKFAAGHPSEKLNLNWRDTTKKFGAVIMTGPKGIGKSAWACARLFEKDEGYFIRLIELIAKIRLCWDPKSEIREEDVFEHFCNLPLLVVDEVGSQMKTENERLLISRVLVYRYENYLDTILTSNLDLNEKESRQEFEACLGDMVTDRIMGGWVDCKDWPRCRE